jgi:hypothetical protein
VLDYAIPAVILLSVMVVLAPVPAAVVDLLLAANLTLSVLALLGALAARTPLELSIFPTFLLGSTLVRLVLNIATTRLVLSRAAIDGDAAAGQVVQAESPATEYSPATHAVQTVCAVSAAYVLASQLAQTVEPVPPNFHTPARVQIWPPTQLQGTILMYRATTGSMNISSLFSLLLKVAAGKNLTPPFACDCTEENPEF